MCSAARFQMIRTPKISPQKCHLLSTRKRAVSVLSSARASHCYHWKSSTTTTNCSQSEREQVVASRTLLFSTHNKRSLQFQDKKNEGNKETSKVSVVYDRPTHLGEKKDTSCPLPVAYNPRYVEAAWYEWWVKSGYFTPEYTSKIDNSISCQPFVMCLPPPNVTGNLHLGHALTNSIQDALVRWHRMKGEVSLWNPGCDHAGIATQVVVEKKLWKENKLSRHDVGREKFIEEVWKWKDEKGDQIYHQMKKLGSSLDWSRARFTMDQSMSRAVCEAFIRLHDDGLIYRSNRIVNWSCQLKSTISDIEVENQELSGRSLVDVPGYAKKVEFGVLHSFAYPVEGCDQEVVVSTTRLETMLGDTAIAVHSDDHRFSHLHGKFVLHPFENRRLPIIFDQFVDRSFGTGAVKVTPAHDPTDYEVSVSHDLLVLTVIDDEGRMTNVTSDFRGLKRFDAREAVLHHLMEKGLYRGNTDNPMALPRCSRSRDVIEPRLKEQWFVSCHDMAQQAILAVRSGELKIRPTMYEHEWFHWLENIRDWCISRQLWWGHRIPAYLAKHKEGGSGVWVCGHDKQEALAKALNVLNVPAEEVLLKQDEDVLDTWFSSALFPFSIFGWPNQTGSMDQFYPTSLLETGSDILFFWVARMVMLGQHLTGQLPFNEVLLHGMLRDAHGRKMSKSLGNIIDPMDVIQGISLAGLHQQIAESSLSESEINKAKQGQKKDFPDGIPECGADALRFALCSYNFKGQIINMDVIHVKSYRHFCNKIWQAFKFVTMNLGDNFQPSTEFMVTTEGRAVDQWILSRLSHMVQSCDQNFKSHDLHMVTKALHQFWYMEFCNVYLECVKPILHNSQSLHSDTVRNVLCLCVDTALRATSPFMPFLTEELYQRLPKSEDSPPESICIAPYPQPEEYPWRNERIEEEMAVVQHITTRALSIKKDFNIMKVKANCFVHISDDRLISHLEKYKMELEALSRAGDIRFVSDIQSIPDGCVESVINHNCSLHMHLKDLVDPAKESERLKKRQAKVTGDLDNILKVIEKSKYSLKKTEEIEQRYSDKMAGHRRELEQISEALDSLNKLR